MGNKDAELRRDLGHTRRMCWAIGSLQRAIWDISSSRIETWPGCKPQMLRLCGIEYDKAAASWGLADRGERRSFTAIHCPALPATLISLQHAAPYIMSDTRWPAPIDLSDRTEAAPAP